MSEARRAAYALRFALTLPYTLFALVWGLCWGGRLTWHPGCFIECSGMRGGYPRGGLTIGSLWLCGGLNDERRLVHEAVHATQWAIFGPLLPPLYWIAELFRPHGRNPFERWAGLRDGGYLP
ncbi:MAG: hypothetical protein M3R30_02635 [Candidatus Eremiobacteraeota bacterium]|nr:hypothetical protein [Candidatus Eremiobacteraeota bacterium]